MKRLEFEVANEVNSASFNPNLMQLSAVLSKELRSFKPIAWNISGSKTKHFYSDLEFGVTTSMLRFLTKKLKSQSLSEVQTGIQHAEVNSYVLKY